jgi:hypothetical protein
MSRGRVAVVFVLAVGCAHFDLDDGAPGLTDVAQPPEHLDWFMVTPATPPGDRMLVLTPALFGVLGQIPAGRDHLAGEGFGAEVALEYGVSQHYHRTLPGENGSPSPDRGVGLALGWTTFTSAPAGGSAHGPVYAEARLRLAPAATAGLGFFIHPNAEQGYRQRGPQVSAITGPLFLRLGYVLGEGACAQVGVDVWGTLSWVWSR